MRFGSVQASGPVPLSAEPPSYPYEVCTAESDRSCWTPMVAEFFDYWLRISPVAGLPGRQHFDPLDVPALLSRIWLFEVHRDPLRFRVRLFGTQLVSILHTDPTGKWLDQDSRLSPNIDGILKRFARVVEEGIATHIRHRGALFGQKNDLVIENVTVPLARDGKTVDMLAGLSWITALDGGRL